MTFEVSGETAGGVVVWTYGSPGNYVHGGPVCPGASFDITNPKVASIGTATSVTVNVPAGACGNIRVQCLDVQSCTVSNYIDL
jgi:hypothetical protein